MKTPSDKVPSRELDILVHKWVMGRKVLAGEKIPAYSFSDYYVIEVMDKIRAKLKKCVLIEASVNPEEYLATLGWHYRGQWMRDLQVKAATPALAICLLVAEL